MLRTANFKVCDDPFKLPHASKPKVTCRVFEDNVGALELAHTHELRPRTKHLSVQLHHFRQCVLDPKVIVEKICATHQRADAFAKALPRDARNLHHRRLGCTYLHRFHSCKHLSAFLT